MSGFVRGIASPSAKENGAPSGGAPMHFQETSVTSRIMPQLTFNYKNDFVEQSMISQRWRLAFALNNNDFSSQTIL
jgi:hypothetical protein